MAQTDSSGDPVNRYCLTCGYDLRSLAGPHCPECGREFDPADDTPYRRPRYDARQLIIEVSVVFACAGLAVVLSSAASFVALAAILAWQVYSFRDAFKVLRHEPGRIDHKAWMRPALIAQAILLVLLLPVVGITFVLAVVFILSSGLL